MSVRIIVGDALSALRDLPDESVHCVVTSPPYWGLRSYGGDPGMMGLEPTFEEHIDNLVAVFREVRRVLRKDGTLWLNYGDAYCSIGHKKAGSGYGTTGLAGGKAQEHHPLKRESNRPGLKHKDLMLMPTDVARALQADGWWLRSMIPQIKSNPMPESVKDRPTNAVEYWFLLTKAPKYFYDQEAVKEPVSGTANARVAKSYKMPDGWDTGAGSHGTIHRKGREKGKTPGVTPKSAEPGSGIKQNESFEAALTEVPATRNMRNWVMAATAPFKGAHFATFAPHIVEPWIKAGTSEMGGCSECGAPWGRGRRSNGHVSARKPSHVPRGHSKTSSVGWQPTTEATGWSPSCECGGHNLQGIPTPPPPVPCAVLDPFAGSGTVGLVAERLGRDSILIEINPDYADMARERIAADAPLLSAPELIPAQEAAIG